ncbi:MAG: motility associated factor glycosyltransferase family protein, partial [Desulfobulbaceae bacterium]|nr:motility associated factor glycosyltransferase family protein [Desulfobulbaceae bacterium]
MKTDYFKANMSLLRLFHSKTYNTIIKAMTEPMGRITMLPNGLPDLKVNDNKGGEISLHDNPDSEISEYLSRVPENEPSAVILLGMGLGYTPEALLLHRPQMRQLVIFEFFPGIFIQALHTRDLSQLLSDPRVILSVGPEPDIGEVLTPAYKTLQLEHIHILRHLPSFSINMAGYQKLHDEMFDHVNRLNIGGSTLVKMGKHFLENRFCNLTSIRHNRLIDSLKDKFSGIPAILVASGPSLDENIHLLAEAKGKAVIIAIDSALPSLLAHGVKPDFITALDPDDVVYEKIAASAAQGHGINFVCQLGVTPKTPKIFPADQVFWAFNDNILTKLVNISLGGKINIGETHSNAHLNLVTAIVMGASPIIFVGQDLAFTGGKSHTSHTVLKEHDIWEKRLQETDDTVLTDSINGGKVKTHRGFFAAKVLFEEIMAKHPNRYINATAAGVHLQGTEALCLDEAIERFCSASTGIK